jgi:hypothetical protein
VPIGVRATIRSAEMSEGGSLVDNVSSMGKQALLEAVVFEEDIVRTGSVAGNFGSAELAAQTLFRKIYGDGR